MGAKLAILGAGNIGGAIARGLVACDKYGPGEIVVTRRHEDSLAELAREGFRITANNVEAVAEAPLLIVCVQPGQTAGLLDEVADALDPGRHRIVSVVTGIESKELRRMVGDRVPVVRIMPNTAIVLGESMTCIARNGVPDDVLNEVREVFDSLGQTLVIDEELMTQATALCACGVAFFLRAIRAASQGGIEIGFHADDAITMAAQTARGAASLLLGRERHPEREIDRVTTPMGCTIAGLNQMEHGGFSSALIRGIVTSADKAATLGGRQENP